MRLDKYLANSGVGTRKEVKEFIKKGHVTVNDTIIKKDSYHIDPNTDHIYLDEEEVIYEEFVYYMLNKPQGYVSATEDNVYPTVIDLIHESYHLDLFPVGRLDVDTEGLLLITNDGHLAHQLLSPKNKCPKCYYAIIDGVVTDDDVIAFKNRIMIDDYECLPSELNVLDTTDSTSQIEVIIYEGKYHQVKRMFEAVGKKVTYLQRLSMKTLTLDESLPLGEYRRLSEEELKELKNKER